MPIFKDVIAPMVVLVFLASNLFTIDGACRGSVIFYWHEKGQQRQIQQRNWGVLEKEIKSNKAKLSVLGFDTENAYGYKVNGDCCWEIYTKNGYRGDTARLMPLVQGFRGLPFKANSLKKVPC